MFIYTDRNSSPSVAGAALHRRLTAAFPLDAVPAKPIHSLSPLTRRGGHRSPIPVEPDQLDGHIEVNVDLRVGLHRLVQVVAVPPLPRCTLLLAEPSKDILAGRSALQLLYRACAQYRT